MRNLLLIFSANILFINLSACILSPVCSEQGPTLLDISSLDPNAPIRTDGYYYCTDSCQTGYGGVGALFFYEDGSLLNHAYLPNQDSVTVANYVAEVNGNTSVDIDERELSGVYSWDGDCLRVEMWHGQPWCGYFSIYLVGSVTSDSTFWLTHLPDWAGNDAPSCSENIDSLEWRFQPLEEVPIFTSPLLD
ncbi:MAG TPA: hypothetical protein DCE41_05185 [Cytophagales bacterium]|nr:hypothetical protein [Cytophagales bacterium]HAA17459.1 hypothetical protein [Cytophagales bacterium]HAP64893.1 hypothetical protein [Cytophagales bacterium]